VIDGLMMLVLIAGGACLGWSCAALMMSASAADDHAASCPLCHGTGVYDG
jgi:hypothetical protein